MFEQNNVGIMLTNPVLSFINDMKCDSAAVSRALDWTEKILETINEGSMIFQCFKKSYL
jgi:hypothetical protein